jgi:hypothetical protein
MTDLPDWVLHRQDWGPWRLTSEGALEPSDPGQGLGSYQIDLATCTDSANVLDWIVQVAHKLDATDAIVAGLVRALDDILQLQSNVCGWGTSKTMTREQIAYLVNTAIGHGWAATSEPPQ